MQLRMRSPPMTPVTHCANSLSRSTSYLIIFFTAIQTPFPGSQVKLGPGAQNLLVCWAMRKDEPDSQIGLVLEVFANVFPRPGRFRTSVLHGTGQGRPMSVFLSLDNMTGLILRNVTPLTVNSRTILGQLC